MNRMNIGILWFMIMLIIPSSIVNADETNRTKPNVEIKFLLDSGQVLDEDYLLRANVRDHFDIENEYIVYDVIYLDTQEREFLKAGWVNRIRLKEGKSKYTLTYKKRYPVLDFDIETALTSALKDGFSLNDERFSAEIDWGYNNMTLSFSAEAEIKTKEPPDIRDLAHSDAVQMLADHFPPEEDTNAALLENIKSVGPIRFLRYFGTFEENEIRIEIWPIPGANEMQYVVEFSAKCGAPEAAAAFREDIIVKLDEMGILIHRDALKTALILNGLDALNK